MKKTAHQIYIEAKQQNLSDKEFGDLLRKEGVIVSKESLEKQHQIAENIKKKLKN